MTFDDRVRALEPLGFSDRQTRFIVTVALHGGFCLRRHYTAFAGLLYGAGVRDFLDRLVTRQLARRLAFRPDRGHVYHLNATAIYAAIGQDDHRSRRHTSPALIARHLMLLDFVLSVPSAEWYATEGDKVALFRDRFGVPLSGLPHRIYPPSRHEPRAKSATRRFIHKLPIYIAVDSPAVAFVFLVTDTTGQALGHFLRTHAPLLSDLDHWEIVLVLPPHVLGLRACEAAFRTFLADHGPATLRAQRDLLRDALALRVLINRNNLAGVGVEALNRYRETRQQFGASAFDDLFTRWSVEGEPALAGRNTDGIAAAIDAGRGRLVSHRLAFRYDRFGSRPGVC